MELNKIVNILDDEFDIENTKEDWSNMFDTLFIQKSLDSFRKPIHNTGLMIKNSDEVNKIYLSFSPSRYILEEIHMKGIVNVLLVVKNPFDWDGRRSGKGFFQFTERDYQLMEGMGISIYSLHTPMNINRNDVVISSAYALAKVFKIKVEEECINDLLNPGKFIGVIGKAGENKIESFTKKLSSILNYKVKLRKASDNVGKVAILSGRGFVPDIIEQAAQYGATTYITGVITPNSSDFDRKNYGQFLSLANKLGINIIGCSNYITEKLSMQLSLSYFSNICKAEFIEDNRALNMLE